jgi:CHAT domain-containing protein
MDLRAAPLEERSFSMNACRVKRWAGSSILGSTIALAGMLLGILSDLRSEQLPVPEKPTAAQLQIEFDQADALRITTPEKTKERAEAAKKEAKIASDIAWLVFDAGKFEEAASWFVKSAELKADSHLNARGYWEEYRRGTVAQTEGALAARIKEFQTQLATAEESKKGSLRISIDALEKIRFTMSYTSLSMLESVARENGSTEDLIEYGKEELDILHRELAYLLKSGAPKHDIDLKNAQIASTLERTAGEQAEMASFDEAEENYFAALEIRRALPAEMPERKVENTLSDLGSMHLHNIGDLTKARDYFQQALAEMDASAPARQKALTDDPWTAEQKQGMTPEQLAAHQASLFQTRDLSLATDTISQCTVLANLGAVAQQSGDFKTALSFYERASGLVQTLPQGGYLNIFQIVRAQIGARTLSDISYLHAESGEEDLALKELNDTIALQRQIGRDENTAQSLQQAASLAYDTGDNETARHDVEQARRIFATAQKLQNVVSTTDFLAILARDEGRLEAAADYSQEALQLARKTGNLAARAASARTFASVRLKQNRLPEAKELIEEAAAADALSESVVDKIATLGVAGELLEAEGRDESALATYKEAVIMLESMRATAASEASFADQKRTYRAYERIVRILIKLNRPDEAFDYLNRAKSKKLHDSLQLASMKSGDKSMQDLLDRANGLENKLAAANRGLRNEQTKPEAERDKDKIVNLKLAAAAAQGEYLKVSARIKESNPNWQKFMTVTPEALKTGQKNIPVGVLFVQYAPLGEQLYIFLVGKETLKILIAPIKPEDLWKKIKAVRRQITTGEAEGPLNANLSALYESLITPIEAELAQVKVIAFIPNQLLFYLPMQALIKTEANGEKRYLIEDKQIVYLTTADVMNVVQLPDEDKSRQGMVAFGNPTGAELPSAEIEVEAIAKFFPETEVLLGVQATKAALSGEERLDKRVVHFATHGILNATQPSESYILLASGETPGQERLTQGEVLGLPFNKVDLVTLSACETAFGGRDPDGGEVTTLAAAFSSAGATSVLASLWSVGDESTKEFMIQFYTQLAAGRSKAASLQSAQIALMKNPKFSHPLYWAPFVLMGDWR